MDALFSAHLFFTNIMGIVMVGIISTALFSYRIQYRNTHSNTKKQIYKGYMRDMGILLFATLSFTLPAMYIALLWGSSGFLSPSTSLVQLFLIATPILFLTNIHTTPQRIIGVCFLLSIAYVFYYDITRMFILPYNALYVLIAQSIAQISLYFLIVMYEMETKNMNLTSHTTPEDTYPHPDEAPLTPTPNTMNTL